MLGLSERRRNSAPALSTQPHYNIHLVLDIDHTLLETLDRKELMQRNIDQENVMPFSVQFKDSDCHCFFRPHLREFLNWAFATCKTVSIYTAAQQYYALWVLPRVGKYPWFQVLTSDHVIWDAATDESCKPLSNLWERPGCRRAGMDHTNTIHIDDKEENFSANPVNGITIRPFEVNNESLHDTELLKLKEQIIAKYHSLQRLYKSERV